MKTPAVISALVLASILASSRAHDPAAPMNMAPAAQAYRPKPLPPELQARLDELRKGVIPSEALDEAMGGKTLHGTPITPRTPECFPAESRDIFWQMDMVADGDGPLRPINFDTNHDGVIDDNERDAIRGRNTWILWAGGNEGFWNWLAQDGYGISDFLVLLDSRVRGSRFKRAGLINQPHYGFDPDPSKRILGLYLDTARTNATRYDPAMPYASHTSRFSPPVFDKRDPSRSGAPPNHAGLELFQPGDPVLYESVRKQLADSGDGVNYDVYGYPSGVVGMRLFLNPDFFGPGKAPARARAYWTNRVINTNGRYYTDPAIQKDPRLVRPFRVGISCGFCHVGPHPLNPPADPEDPDWQNLSSTIGNQYWKPQPAFANLLERNSFLYHFLASQQPGTVDTSLVSSDQINNANTINAVFEVSARLARAALNPTERQSAENVRVPMNPALSIEDPNLIPKHDNNDWRHTPRVLLDGSDSIGAFGALARVYLNIGTFYEEWLRCHNAIIGFRRQRPFQLSVCQANSVYWQVNEQYRTKYLARYFTLRFGTNGVPPGVLVDGNFASPENIKASQKPHDSTQAMKLATAKEGDGLTPSKAAKTFLDLDAPADRIHGRELWLRNCAICHSSKQPDGFGLTFERSAGDWAQRPAPTNHVYTLPMDAAQWPAFKRSPAYSAYVQNLLNLVAAEGQTMGIDDLSGDPLTDDHPFWKSNYLSTDIRVPLTLAGTPSGRAMASNGLQGEVWDNFSSLTYKGLPSVGSIAYNSCISGQAASFEAPGGGRGYYRPATHVSLWATAPFLHNNAMGLYLDDPSVKGRLVQFTDGIRRVLYADRRSDPAVLLRPDEQKWLQDNGGLALPASVRRSGDLRGLAAAAAIDSEFVYRLPQDTTIEFAPRFIKPLIQGVAGKTVTAILAVWLWVFLVPWLAWLAWKHNPRLLGITLVFLAALVAAGIGLSGLVGSGTTAGALLMGISGLLRFGYAHWIIIAVVFLATGVLFIETKTDSVQTARWILRVILAGIVVGAGFFFRNAWLTTAAAIIAIIISMRARPTLAGFSRWVFGALAVVTLLIGYVANSFIHGRVIAVIPIVNVKIGPLPASVGPIPRGTPVNLMMSLDPESPKTPRAVVALVSALAEIKHRKLVGDAAWELFKEMAGQPLLDASKCPDFGLDKGHLFGETLDPDADKNRKAKEDLIAFLKTL